MRTSVNIINATHKIRFYCVLIGYFFSLLALYRFYYIIFDVPDGFIENKLSNKKYNVDTRRDCNWYYTIIYILLHFKP